MLFLEPGEADSTEKYEITMFVRLASVIGPEVCNLSANVRHQETLCKQNKDSCGAVLESPEEPLLWSLLGNVPRCGKKCRLVSGYDDWGSTSTLYSLINPQGLRYFAANDE
jgi:hypothetical protein